MANIRTRGFVETSDNVMISGFIAGGRSEHGDVRVVVRALGPSLRDKAVPNPLQDPRLELHDQNGAVVASNDDWRTTAIVRGRMTSRAGVGLVEIYNVQ